MPELLIGVILGLVEGLTEFIPVSSTGHLIIVADALDFRGPVATTFEIVIQLGAILAVVIHYRERLLSLLTHHDRPGFAGRRGVSFLALTTAPAAIVGAATHGLIREHLFTSLTVAIGLVVGGIAILVVERLRPAVRVTSLDRLRWQHAAAIGLFQCLALWPGASRSAATILGAMLVGTDRRTAAEYSFLAAIPIIGAAATFDLYQSWHLLTLADAPLFLTGFSVAFISAWLAIHVFLRLLARVSLAGFGWYRIGIGLLLVTLNV